MSQSITTSSFENPEDFVSNHPITLELIQHGVSELQLQTMRFRRNNQGWPFDQWPTTWNGNIPIGAIPLVKGYCALKWLIVDNPPYSREKEDAWRYLNDLAIAPFVALGMKHQAAQRSRSRRPRSTILDDGRSLQRVIADLAQRAEFREETARELWPRLYAALNEAGLDLRENAANRSYEYSDHRGRRKHISYRHFANIISR